MRIEQIINIMSLAGVCWSALIYVPKALFSVYREMDKAKDMLDARIDDLDKKIEQYRVLLQTTDSDLVHRFELHVQQTSMSLKTIDESIKQIYSLLEKRFNV